MSDAVRYLPHVDALLNGLATILLVVGFVFIKTGRREAHRRAMLACFAVSCVFLACYLVYHTVEGSRNFPESAPPAARYAYFAILISHVILAATVPVLASVTIFLGLRGNWARHRAWARWTFPIWLYVSVTGVVVYALLYHIYAP